MTDANPHHVELAEAVFLDAIRPLRDRYQEHTFFVERDVVCWVQLHIRDHLPDGMRVFNDYGIVPGPRRARSADLAIVNESGVLLLVAEFKFEPCARRTDIIANKLPVIAWINELTDIARIEEFVALGATHLGWSICVDEGGRYRSKQPPSHSQVEDWATGYGTEVTLTRWPVAVVE